MSNLDFKKYHAFIGEFQSFPRQINNPAQYERARQVLERFLIPERELLFEEEAVVKFLLALVDSYELRTTKPPASTPSQVLRHLMDQRRLKQADLAPIFGTVSVVSEVLNGKHQINAKQARKLATYFHISTDVFI